MISDLQRSIDDCWDPAPHSSQMILLLYVMQGWMNSWGYANKIPTSVWRGSMTVPRYRCHLLRHLDPDFSKYRWAPWQSRRAAPRGWQRQCADCRWCWGRWGCCWSSCSSCPCSPTPRCSQSCRRGRAHRTLTRMNGFRNLLFCGKIQVMLSLVVHFKRATFAANLFPSANFSGLCPN